MSEILQKMSHLLKIKRAELCKGCIKPEKYYGPFKDGYCSTCKGEDEFGQTLNSEEKRKFTELTDNLFIKSAKDNKMIAIGLSGGKDSTLLVNRVIQRSKELGVNNTIAAITVRIPTESETIIPNLNKFKNIVKSKNLPVKFYEIRPSFDLYQFYKDIILSNVIVVRDERTADACNMCSDLLESLVIKKAVQLGCDLILFGLSPDESNRFIGKIPEEKLQQGLFPKKMAGKFTENVQDDFYHPSWGKVTVLFPFHYWEYDELEAKTKSLDYIEESDPLKTNCSLVYLNMVLDLFTLGKMVYIESYSRLIKEGSLSRSDGISYLKAFLSLVKNENSFVWTEHINPILEKFGMTFDELVDMRKEVLSKMN
ncbi:MAG: hypothetical protein ACTSPY_02480 [Candidatus Helarchaeota archaeon]